ncbi:nickel import ATP-binding protein NikE [Enterobacter sp. SA187]|uniref:nickel import ATP-binding protein NikE n=1 Tax=Enterobacter sp. SA187 TaxID=1914861 RepID=UPI000933A4D1|nr:nickel import ATP-binding protein NikE [Enterobacter sp. SA187]
MTLIAIHQVSHGYTSSGLFRRGQQKAVLEDISFDIRAGETLALLGRSGCGKSTLARLIAGLEKPQRGEVRYQGQNIHRLARADAQRFRQDVQMVFQDALSAVNPRKTVAEIIAEPLRHLTSLSAAEQQERILTTLTSVELDDAFMSKLPSQLSGGQLQRVCLARALAVRPKLLVLDEAVSNLDLVLQAHIVALLKQLQAQLNIGFLFITHDLRLVKRFCQRVMVMDNGHIIETRPVDAQLCFATPAGIALQQAVLPAFPVR